MSYEFQKKSQPERQPEELNNSFLAECAWEVCNQLGGIYTVIRSKAPVASAQWGNRYCLVGPDIGQNVNAEIDLLEERESPLGKAVDELSKSGFTVKYGTWLVTGRPKVVLLGIKEPMERIDQLADNLKADWNIPIQDDLQKQVLAFGHVSSLFYQALEKQLEGQQLIGHFHEWMASLPILFLKQSGVKTIFTTHATAIGRYLAMNDDNFYHDLSGYNWETMAEYFNILPIAKIERYSAREADVFTTVSNVTARECEVFYGVRPHTITPNGLNIQRFVAVHEVQNLHQEFKDEINEFIMGHFFHSSPFDLDNTLYFFTSGRYEFKNKGYDITLEALNLLNKRLQKEKVDKTVVMFFITRRDTWSINPVVMEQRGVMEEIRNVCQSITDQLGKRLFQQGTQEQEDYRLPDLNELIDDYWRLRYRRTLQSWKSDQWPIVVTHNLKNDEDDDIINYIRSAPLVNNPKDKVKIVYHPDFIDSSNPLFGIDYNDFVRGCHLGIFPSYYEPWGYTPLECLAHGVPAITSDLTGFGDFMTKHFVTHEQSGGFLLRRYKLKPELVVKELAEIMYNYVKMSKRERINLRNKAEDLAENFDWAKLYPHYNSGYLLALN